MDSMNMNGLCSRLHVTFPTLSQTRNSAGRTGHGILSWSHRCPGWRQYQPRCRCQLCSGQSLAWGAAQWRTGAKMRWWHIDSEMIHKVSPHLIWLAWVYQLTIKLITQVETTWVRVAPTSEVNKLINVWNVMYRALSCPQSQHTVHFCR